MADRLKGKIAIVTGGGTGIGEATAHKFASEGANILVVGLPTDPMDEVARAIGERYGVDAAAFGGDIADEDTARRAVARAIDQFGRLDVLCNIAGVFLEVAETPDYSVESFDATLRNNCRTAFLMSKFALPHLQESHGVVLFAGSAAGFQGESRIAPYGGSKGFIHAFARGLAHEQAQHGVRINVVCPGPVDTAWTRSKTGPLSEDQLSGLTGATLIGRRQTPEEMANVFAFLASDEASAITGALWAADGGATIVRGAPGDQADIFFKTPPEGVLTLAHSHDGQKGKTLVNRL